MTNRLEIIKRRIKSLLNKTVENGCTEAEAMIAAEKAAQLLATYSIDQSSIDITVVDLPVDIGFRSMRTAYWPTICEYTNTFHLLVSKRSSNELTLKIFGQEPWPDVAAYLIAVCDRAILTEINKFHKSTIYRRKRTRSSRMTATADFTSALSSRIEDKIQLLFAENRSSEIRAKMQRFAEKKHDFISVSAPEPHSTFSHAYLAGDRAGENININFGVTGASPLAIKQQSE